MEGQGYIHLQSKHLQKPMQPCMYGRTEVQSFKFGCGACHDRAPVDADACSNAREHMAAELARALEGAPPPGLAPDVVSLVCPTAMIARWEPESRNRASYDGVVAMVGGPDHRYLPEHEHPDLQLSVHFGQTSNIRLTAPSEPHTGEWKDGERVAVVLLSPALLAQAADDLVRRGPCAFRSGSYARDDLIRELARAVMNEFSSPFSTPNRRLYFESIKFSRPRGTRLRRGVRALAFEGPTCRAPGRSLV
jgi:hypothetical protein